MDDQLELRSRNRAGPSGFVNNGYIDDSKNYVDHKVQTNDTIQKIGLFYSVPVSEIKRMNNIFADHELYALPNVKVPVSRLRLHYLNELHQEQTGRPLLNPQGIAVPLVSSLNIQHDQQTKIHTPTEEKPDSSSNDEDTAMDKIDALLGKTDKTVAQARNQLPPSPSLEDGSHGRFHFVNANAPDSASKGTWYLIIGVVLMFVVIPLLLTLLEEHNEAELELKHQHQREHLQHSHLASN